MSGTRTMPVYWGYRGEAMTKIWVLASSRYKVAAITISTFTIGILKQEYRVKWRIVCLQPCCLVDRRSSSNLNPNFYTLSPSFESKKPPTPQANIIPPLPWPSKEAIGVLLYWLMLPWRLVCPIKWWPDRQMYDVCHPKVTVDATYPSTLTASYIPPRSLSSKDAIGVLLHWLMSPWRLVCPVKWWPHRHMRYVCHPKVTVDAESSTSIYIRLVRYLQTTL